VTPFFARVSLLRHGQSIGNVAQQRAEGSGIEVIDLQIRDADVPLTPLGREQAAAAGRRVSELAPDLVVCSTYFRAAETTRIALAEAAELRTPPPPSMTDERLRDRELGVLDLLTSHGVAARYPDEQARRRHLGKFYYRPPGGESWADVVLRLRSLLDELGRSMPGQNVLLVGHEMTVFALRYLLEGVAERDLLRLAAETRVANGSITTWEPGESGRYQMTEAHETNHLRRAETPPTEDEDAATHLT
jgi:probable phosphoglycerate mutase